VRCGVRPLGRRVERTRNSGSWTEARFFGFIRSALRSAFQKWGPKHEARRNAKLAYNTYECAACGDTFGSKDVQVDHIVPAGSLKEFSDLPGFVERMFCEVDGFQVLCKDCHQVKTNEERKSR
jgi:5-methylcytosine-specific restriction endonuclease McrA